jgi:HNH endonuclease
MSQMLTQQVVKEHFEYKDGFLYWKKCNSNRVSPGKRVDSFDSKGYIQTMLFGKRQRAHRLIYLYHHGVLPKFIDHIDGNRANNKIENLRPATASENQHNRKARTTNKIGIKNISWSTRDKVWTVGLNVNGTCVFKKSFQDLELAELVAQEVRDKYHKTFARAC